MIWNPAEFTDLHLPPWLVLLSVDSDSLHIETWRHLQTHFV